MNELTRYLISRKTQIIKPQKVVIPPLNTDIRFGEVLPIHQPLVDRELQLLGDAEKQSRKEQSLNEPGHHHPHVVTQRTPPPSVHPIIKAPNYQVPPSSINHHSPPSSINHHSPPPSINQQVPPSSTNHHSPPSSTNHKVPPYSINYQVPPYSINYQVPPSSTNHHSPHIYINDVLKKTHSENTFSDRYNLPPDTEELYDDVTVIDRLRAGEFKKERRPITEHFKPTMNFKIPPLNTDIRFTRTLPRYGVVKHHDARLTYGTEKKHDTKFHETRDGSSPAGDPLHARGKVHYHDHVHENFSWVIPSQHDDDEAVIKKMFTHSVVDQQGCGSCWAICVATTMSDCVVVGETLTERAPLISYSYCMSCYPQHQCSGGVPATLALAIEKTGVGDTSCMDASWCDDNATCRTPDSSEHFETANPTELSKLIPRCKCSAGPHLIYYLDKGTDTFSIDDNMPLETYKILVKYHMLDFGPVIGGYIVLSNFTDGVFTTVNKGVYLDRADYSNIRADGIIPFSDSIYSHTNVIGLHAVSIVGWGVATDIQYDTNKRGDVPFWHCRNSWGTAWGDHGYFKIAMYPYNKISQFEKIVNVNVGKNSEIQLGGLMLIRATQKPVLLEHP